MNRLRLHVIACKVFLREFCYYASTNDNIIDFTWLPYELHNSPDKLRNMLNDAVAEVEKLSSQGLMKKPDAIILGYGLCSNGTTGVMAKSIPIIVPRTDDCMGIFLGSQEKYLRLFNEYNGTYWLNNGWLESGSGAHIRQDNESKRQMYIEKYGEENADFLLEQDNLWMNNYNYSGFVTSDIYQNDEYKELAKKVAKENNWQYVEIEGDSSYIKKMMAGNWNENEFLVCPPGYTIQPSYDETKIKAVLV